MLSAPAYGYYQDTYVNAVTTVLPGEPQWQQWTQFIHDAWTSVEVTRSAPGPGSCSFFLVTAMTTPPGQELL
jgi:hypothetical protein